MQKINVTIEGESPYLMHAFSMEDAQEEEKKKIAKKDYSADVEKCLYKTADGVIYVPSTQIHGALIEAGKKFQIPGKSKATFSKIIGGLVIVTPDAIEMSPQTYTVDKRAVVVPSTKGRVVRFRAKFDKWKLRFTIENMEPEQIQTSTLKKILDYAGSYEGIGDFRPNKKGPFGRFIVTLFDAVKS